MSERFEAGDVFWAPDPYSGGGNPRPWLVLAAETIPYAGEEYICAGLTLSDLPNNVEVTEDDWVTGNDPGKTSYCSPRVLAAVKHDAVAGPQGCVTAEFHREMVDQSEQYLTGDLNSETRRFGTQRTTLIPAPPTPCSPVASAALPLPRRRPVPQNRRARWGRASRRRDAR